MKKLLVVLMMLVMASGAFAAEKWPKKIVFGVIPTASQSQMKNMWQPIVKHIEKSLGVKVELKLANDYASVINAMKFDHVQCAYFGPKSYVEAAKRSGAEALVIEVSMDGNKGYHGYIITKKGSGLKSLDDLKGKKWAFTDPNSTSGTLVPTVYFGKIKLNPNKYFSKVIYSGSHQNSIMSVKNGTVDGASTNDLDFARGLGAGLWKNDDFNILWTSDLIPAAPIACKTNLPASFKMAMRGALVSIDSKYTKNLKVLRYDSTDDSFYNPIRELIKVKNELKKKNK